MKDIKVCSECNEPSDEFNTDKFGKVICGECGAGSHCFCEECDEYVPTSHCTMKDGIVHEVDGLSVDESKVICNVCDENSDEDNSCGWDEKEKKYGVQKFTKPSQDHRGDYVKIKASDLNSICEIAKKLLRKVGKHKQEAFHILQLAQQPLQERDPQNLN